MKLGVQPRSSPPSPPAPPPPPPPPGAAAAIRPSDGCTSTQPSPLNAIWMLSPEPRPMSVLRLTSVFIDVVTPDDHVIAAWASANVGAVATFSRTGGPSDRIATQPVPESEGLNRPPPIIPLA